MTKNTFEQKSSEIKNIMVSYLSDLMEDATDFSWQGAKAGHAVLLCEMQQGSLQWEDMDHIDQIRRAHAQKHISNKSIWAISTDHSGRKPWYCKNYQSGACTYSHDNEFNRKLHKHICSFYLAGGGKWSILRKNVYIKTKLKKRSGSCPSLGCSSCNEVVAGDNQKLITSVTGATSISGGGVVAPAVTLNVENYTRLFYSSKVVPTEVEALLARRHQNCTVLSNSVKSCVFSRTDISRVSQVVPETRISLGANQTRSSVENNDLSQPIVHPSTVNGDDGLYNALQKANYSRQDDKTRGRTPGLESTGPGFESRRASSSLTTLTTMLGSAFRTSFVSLFDLMKKLGLTINDKKLVPPSTKVVYLDMLINTEEGTVSIPPYKLRQINDTVNKWL